MIDRVTLAKFCQEAYTATDTLGAHGCRFIVRDVDGYRVMAWEGTHDMETAAIDLDAVPWWERGIGFVHKGFLDALESSFDAIMGAWSESVFPVIFTGHSLGGALAILAAARMCRDGVSPDAIVTFGAPHASIGARLGELLASHTVTPTMYRHGVDAVPELPIMFDWRHPAPLITIGERGTPSGDHTILRYLNALESIPPECWQPDSVTPGNQAGNCPSPSGKCAGCGRYPSIAA